MKEVKVAWILCQEVPVTPFPCQAGDVLILLPGTEALRRSPRLNMSQFSFCFILINSTS